jgi:hypothetical protein
MISIVDRDRADKVGSEPLKCGFFAMQWIITANQILNGTKSSAGPISTLKNKSSWLYLCFKEAEMQNECSKRGWLPELCGENL